MLRPQSADNHASQKRKIITMEEKRPDPNEIYFDELDKHYTSDYLDRYSFKMIKNSNQLKEELEKNATSFGKKHNINDGNRKKLICKKMQTRKIEYDANGNMIGKPEDYFEDVWLEVDQINESYEHENENDENISDSEDHHKIGQRNSATPKKKKVFIDDEKHVDKLDLSNVKSRLLSKSAKKARKLDPKLEQEKLQRRKDRIKKFGQQTKWLPNSAFTTYYGIKKIDNKKNSIFQKEKI
jgi:hypothetical protein